MRQYLKHKEFIRERLCPDCYELLHSMEFFEDESWEDTQIIRPQPRVGSLPSLHIYGTHYFHNDHMTLPGYIYSRDGVIGITQEEVDPLCIPTLFCGTNPYPKRQLRIPGCFDLDRLPDRHFSKCLIIVELVGDPISFNQPQHHPLTPWYCR